MCRMLAFFSNRPSTIDDLIVHHPRSLIQQSRCDVLGESHSDGWGIGFYDLEDRPHVLRSIKPAHEDADLLVAAESVRTRVSLAHVRQASVGAVRMENTHPFHYGPWLFAHNGTVTGFHRIQDHLLREIDPRLLEHRAGATDSELVFFWLLSCLQNDGIELEPHGRQDRHNRADVLGLVELLGECIRRLAGWSAQAEPDENARLNFLLTDGLILVASRYRQTLYWLERVATPHAPPGTTTEPLRSLIVASEPISTEPWQEVPDRSILAVGESLHAGIHPF